MHHLKHLKKSARPQHVNSGSDSQPTYVFLMSEDTNMKMFINAVIPKNQSAMWGLTAAPSITSSTLFFEIVKDHTSGDLNIEAFFNDEAIPLGGCTSGKACKVSDFAQFLNSTIVFPNVVSACKGSHNGASNKQVFVE